MREAEFSHGRANCGCGRICSSSWTILGVILPEKGLPGTRMSDDVKTEGHILSGQARGVLRAWRNTASCSEQSLRLPALSTLTNCFENDQAAQGNSE
jgi:hypothetical protein